MRQIARARTIPALVLVSALLAVPAALAARKPKAGHWVGRATQPGETLNGRNGNATFTVSAARTRITKFQIPGVTAFCFTGYQVISVAVPDAPIKHGFVNTTYRIPDMTDAKVKLKGQFVSASTFKGEVSSRTYCDYDVTFVAHRRS